MKFLNFTVAFSIALASMTCASDKIDIDIEKHIQARIINNVEFKMPEVERHWHHDGKNKLDISKLKYEIYQICNNLPNITYSKDLAKLIIETLNIETNLGYSDYLSKDHITKNYGLGQFVMSTAKYILKIQKKKNPDVYNALMRYYDKNISLKDNIRKNVRFTIALQLEYYKMCDPNLLEHIGTVTARAKIWKKHYNTVQGAGSVNGYIAATRTRLKNVNI